MFVHSPPCLSDPHGLSTRRACLRVNTSGHKYCIPLIITPLADPGRRHPRATDAGQIRTRPARISRLGTPQTPPRSLGIPGARCLAHLAGPRAEGGPGRRCGGEARRRRERSVPVILPRRRPQGESHLARRERLSTLSPAT